VLDRQPEPPSRSKQRLQAMRSRSSRFETSITAISGVPSFTPSSIAARGNSFSSMRMSG
jgi:hypothetical protein